MPKLKLLLTRALLFALAMIAITCVGETHFSVTWMISILGNELGHFFALVSLACLILLLKFEKSKFKWPAAAMTFATLLVFIRPVATTLLNSERAKSFSLVTSFTGNSTKKVAFERYDYLTGKTSNTAGESTLDYYPANASNESASKERALNETPWVLVIHGGGWDSGDSEQLSPLNHHLAERGYAVFSMNYRLAPKAKWPAAREDTLKAVEFIRSKAGVWNLSSERWAMLGRSAGGQIALATAYSIKEQPPKAVVSYYGPTDLFFAYEISGPDDILDPLKLLKNYLGGTPNEAHANYADASPVNLVRRESAPTLLLHGELDSIVSVKHVNLLRAKLEELNVPFSVLTFPWATHGFDFILHGPGGQVSTNAVEEFLSQHVHAAP